MTKNRGRKKLRSGKMDKITGVEVVIKWMESKLGEPFTYLQFQNSIQEFANGYGRLFRSDTWDRYLRWAIERVQAGDYDIDVPEIFAISNASIRPRMLR